MGGGAGGNFGKTKGSTLDAISNILAVASLIPGVDSFTNAVSIPVDILRGDWLSVGLDVLGVIPVVGEAGDTLKLAKLSDKASDASKVVKGVTKAKSVSDNARNVAKRYSLSKNGYFGMKGKNTRVFKSSDPLKESADFYKKISRGGVERVLPNGKGVQTVFPDNSSVVYRVITKTLDSPAVEIVVKTPGQIKSQKIHFIK